MLILPWYVNLPHSLASWRVTKDWLKYPPPGFDRLMATAEIAAQSFSGGGVRRSNIAALILFGFVGVAMIRRLRVQAFDEHRLLFWLSFAAACAGPLVFDLVQDTYAVAVPRYAITALPFACLLAAVGFACMDRHLRFVVLSLIILAWAPTVLGIYRSSARYRSPLREISRAACANSGPSDLILIHSIPSGVLGIARYARDPAGLASWVGQLGTRRVPDSLRTLANGRRRLVLVKVHEVGEPAPEEDWLRANAAVFGEAHLGLGKIVDFRPHPAETF